ncbi:MAG: hypothetical protein ABR968_10845 [Bacteroidales bacterium]|jgi:hypothetical protein
MKSILVINYSQSGQLDEIIDNFLIPFDKSDIDRIKVVPEKPFPFPYTSKEFFDLMPETVLEETTPLEPINFQSENYELIIIGYQPWYLSPSIPTTALFNNEKFTSLLRGKPVVTIIGARNMWLNSQETIKENIYKAGGILVGNIPLIDRNNNHISAVTMLYWMLTGKKQRYLNLFPFPGVSNDDIKGASAFGDIVFKASQDKEYSDLQKKILDLNLIRIGTDILFIELRAKRMFNVFARLIKKKGTSIRRRAILINLFKYYLLIALFIIAPVVLVFYYLFVFPFQKRSIQRKKLYFCNVKREKE